ncbi:MAG TPA: sigma-54-dependent Fis family transcriptional regulator [Nitrospirae bacterium]|nr:sigma-54-dependent Fis family transcriptional regulator [Nitrospirota bacterium]
MRTYNLLAIDDEDYAVRLINRYCGYREDIKCHGASTSSEALEWAKSNYFDIALIDYKMPGINGVELGQKLKKIHPGSFFIIVTAYGGLEKAVEAMRAGMFDFLTKPLELGEFELAMERAIKSIEINNQNKQLKEFLLESTGKGKLIGDSAQIKAIKQKVQKIARYDAPVLITGETGVGKEVVARMIHACSGLNNSRFVAVNCSAFSESLLESELFGHEKGAFTGADNQRIGRLEMAGDGVILLDELCDISPSTQIKLLRVLQEKEFERVGGNKTIKLKARILSATNKDIQEEIASGRFRGDLYYRLNTIHLHIPPLRERKEDIRGCMDHFLRKFSLIYSKEGLKLTKEAIDSMLAHPWPGNVRQLQNSVELLVIESADKIIDVKHLPDDLFTSSPAERSQVNDRTLVNDNNKNRKIPELLSAMERKSIADSLEENRWNKSKAAMDLGLTLAQLIYRMKKYDIK